MSEQTGSARKKGKAEKPLFLTPSKTAFDYLEGSFAKSERSRLIGIILPGLALVVLGGVSALGAIATLDISNEEESLQIAQSNNQALSAELAVLDSAGGFPTATLISHVQSRSAAVGEVLKGEVAFVEILKELQDSTPPGVSISSVNFNEAAAAGGEDQEDNADITIAAEATSFELISTWVKNLETVTALTGLDVSWSGGGSQVMINVSASFTADATAQRAVDALAAASSDPAPSSATDPGVFDEEEVMDFDE